ncbi:MAG: hypothetical protein J5J00_01210 [Deltaproteobacteria bacterium]|nr:hypothetical protein [Deltaproteobacteria bacterium]
MERQLRMVRRLIILLLVATATMGILGTNGCQIRAMIVDSPTYNFAMYRIESSTPPYQTDSSTVIDVPVYVYGTGAQFAFKVGADANTNCADASGYTAWTAATNRLQADIAAVPDGIVKLCLIGRSKRNALSYNTQEYSKATVYKWNKDTEGPGAFSIDEIDSPSNDNTPTISWTAATGAAAYDVKLSNAPDCSAPFQSFNDVTGTSVNAAAIADGSFHVCVAARSASNLTTQASNNGIQFVIDTTPPGDFTITAPAGTVAGLSQTAEWTAASGAAQYHLMLTSDSGCTNMISEWNSITATTADITVPSEGDYHLCAEAIDAANNKKLSPAMAFSVAGAPQEVIIEDRIGEPSSTNGKPFITSQFREAALGGVYGVSPTKVQVSQTVKVTALLGVGVTSNALGPVSPDDYEWHISISSTEALARTSPFGADILPLAKLPIPSIAPVGTDARGFPSYLFQFKLADDSQFPDVVFQQNNEYWITILGQSTNDFDWLEAPQAGFSDLFVADGAFVGAWADQDGYTTGRAAISIIGQLLN